MNRVLFSSLFIIYLTLQFCSSSYSQSKEATSSKSDITLKVFNSSNDILKLFIYDHDNANEQIFFVSKDTVISFKHKQYPSIRIYVENENGKKFLKSFYNGEYGLIDAQNLVYSVDENNINLVLYKVENSQNTGENEQIIKALIEGARFLSSYEDNKIKIFFNINDKSINFTLSNKTDNTIKVLWDECIFINQDKRSSRIVHSGIRYMDKENSQQPSLIAKNALIEETIFPTDYITLENNKWTERILFADKSSKNLDQEISILLAIQMENVINNYIFTFKFVEGGF